jgi:hypothetical protein
MQDTDFVENPVPFEEEDPELGRLIAWFSRERPLLKLSKILPTVYKAFLQPEGIGIVYYGRPPALKGVGFAINPNAGRNDSCPCNSGKKFKKCCNKS